MHARIAWLGQVWCCETPFSPIPNFIVAILSTQKKDLTLGWGGNFFDSFYLGDFVFKAAWRAAVAASRVRTPGLPLTGLTFDLAATAALCQVMTEKLGKFKKLVPADPTSVLGERRG